ncbi:hypothetical protein [Romboutsia maritimum]|uniref:hypothetical protein n=1 Tax=Romboutsia maritimum TaxID=2020948 RepID=UPI0013146447|nr:hypothetical protein [Romboutsia maritimum]
MAVKRGHERVELTIAKEHKRSLIDLAEYYDMSISELIRNIVIEKLQDEGYID